MSYIKTDRSETIYLHLQPGYYPSELTVVKMAKSLSVKVEPGIVIVKAKITVPGDFFDEALPFAEIEFQPEDAVSPVVTITPGKKS